MNNSEEELGKDIILTFGKYKDSSLHDIATFDPGYVVWLYTNVDSVYVSFNLYKECVIRAKEHKKLYDKQYKKSDNKGSYSFKNKNWNDDYELNEYFSDELYGRND